MNLLNSLRSDLKKAANQKKAVFLQRYFKTGKGDYGEGDIFIGITVPESRKIAIKYADLPLKYLKSLLRSETHEERLIAIIILVNSYNKFAVKRPEIFDFYNRDYGIFDEIIYLIQINMDNF